MGATQMDSLRRQVGSAAHRAAPGGDAMLRQEESLVSQAWQLAGNAAQGEEPLVGQSPGRRNRAFRSRPFPQVATEAAVTAPDGYVRRSPVQPVREVPGYRRRRVLRVVGGAVLLTALLVLLWLVLRTGILAF